MELTSTRYLARIGLGTTWNRVLAGGLSLVGCSWRYGRQGDADGAAARVALDWQRIIDDLESWPRATRSKLLKLLGQLSI